MISCIRFCWTRKECIAGGVSNSFTVIPERIAAVKDMVDIYITVWTAIQVLPQKYPKLVLAAIQVWFHLVLVAIQALVLLAIQPK